MKLPDLSKQLAFFARFKYGKHVKPGRDWLILLLVTIMLLVLSGAWNAWMFFYGTHVAPVESAGEAAPVLSTEKLEAAEALFERRAEEEGRYRNEYHFVDPRLPGS